MTWNRNKGPELCTLIGWRHRALKALGTMTGQVECVFAEYSHHAPFSLERSRLSVHYSSHFFSFEYDDSSILLGSEWLSFPPFIPLSIWWVLDWAWRWGLLVVDVLGVSSCLWWRSLVWFSSVQPCHLLQYIFINGLKSRCPFVLMWGMMEWTTYILELSAASFVCVLHVLALNVFYILSPRTLNWKKPCSTFASRINCSIGGALW